MSSSADDSSTVHRVTSSAAKRQFLVSTRPAAGVNALHPSAMLDIVEGALRADSDIEIVKTLRSRAAVQATQGQEAARPFDPSRTLVARMSDEKAELLRVAGLHRGVIVERDLHLSLSNPGVPEAAELGLLDAAAIAPRSHQLTVEVQVVGENETPLEGTQIVLYGKGLPSEATTDSRGRARLILPGSSLESVRAVYLKPRADHWDIYVQQPNLLSDKLNVIQLTSLATQLPAWGLKSMRLDSLPPEYTGRGAKVAVVDSGIATSHPALTRVSTGIDISHPSSPDGWRDDAISHGTHTAGVIGGAVLANVSIHGIAPEADLLAAKVFPGGRFSDLIEALDFSIHEQVDVVNLSLGHDLGSEIVERKLAEARANGVAVIVAAGNTGGAVQFPARSRHALAVAAIGKLDEFPANTYHAQTILTDPRLLGTEDGFFAAKFSSHGPEIGVAGPGVAVISATSPTNFAVLDGTSIAASHVSGLAALILAHHPDFRDRYRARNTQRVDRLFEILRQSARPLYVGDSQRVGAGLPDAFRALGIEVPSSKEVREGITAGFTAVREQLRGLGILDDNRDPLTGGGARSVPPRAPTSPTATSSQRNGARPQQPQGPDNGARLVNALLLAELRKHLEEAQLIAPSR
ncbi:MAG: S8 family serine peptidase [Polyangiales bacterium]